MRRGAFTLFLTLGAFSVAVVSARSKIRQKRAWIIDSFSIEEESPGPFPYPLGPIELERSYLVHFWLRGMGVDQDPQGVLSIDAKSGVVYAHKKVDYELYDILKLTFEAKNASNNQVDTRLGVEVKILDINDNAPVFEPPHYGADLEESTTQGQSVVRVKAVDKDDGTTPNGTFSFELISVSPATDNVQFFIEQAEKSSVGLIYFRGCLDYEKASKYTIQVRVKDHGPKVQLSSTSTVTVNVIDKNNHPPVITGHTGPGKINERDSGVEVLRIQVSDKDSRGSDAWRAKYTIHGDKEKYFKIEVDPKTNEGILTVIKAMDYEEQTSRNISISVDNLVPYFSCEVIGKPNKRLWDVKMVSEGSSAGQPASKLYPVSIAVQDVNDPPEFTPRVTEVMVWENEKEGFHLTTLKATDPDIAYASKFHFTKGEDVDNWITVDSQTGKVVTAKVLDRESPFVKNSTYSVILYVVDNGEPPLTGTGTLVIHVRDQNDNVPVLEMNKLNMCLSNEATMTNITAVDLDLPPYSDPFRFELLGDVKGKWRIDPTNGKTVNLIKENTVYSGDHELQIKISDSQGVYLIQNVSVAVCDCSSTPNCHVRRSQAARIGNGAVLIMILGFLALAAMFLLTLFMSCKEEKKMIQTDDNDSPGWHLLESNTETPGKDCKVPVKVSSSNYNTNKNTYVTTNNNVISRHSSIYKKDVVDSSVTTYNEQFGNRNTLNRSSTRRSNKQFSSYHTKKETMTNDFSAYNTDVFYLRQTVMKQISQIRGRLQAPGVELSDYDPHCYTYEGEATTDPELDTISFPESDFHSDDLDDLDYRFSKLAAICRPDVISRVHRN